MVLAMVPAAPPTWKSQPATSCPAPISAMVPYLARSILSSSAFCSVVVWVPAIRDSGSHAGGAGKLAGDEMSVQAALGEKIAMTADLGHAAVLQHDDAVGAAHRGEAMRDDQRRAVAGQQIQRPAHRLLTDRVQVRGCLVEDQDGRVLEKGAGDGHALA